MTQSSSSKRSTADPRILLAVGALAVFSLTGCSGKDSDEQTAAPAAASSPANVPAASGAPAAATVPGSKTPPAKAKESDGDE